MSTIVFFLLSYVAGTVPPDDPQASPHWAGFDDCPSLALLQLGSMLVRPQRDSDLQHATLAAEYVGSTRALASQQEEAVISAYDPEQLLAASSSLDDVNARPVTGNDSTLSMALMYPLAMMVVACLISVIYSTRGLAVVLQIMVYVFSLSTMKLSVKYVFATQSFGFPKLVTAVHFAASSLFGFAVLYWRSRAKDGRAIVVPSLPEMLTIGPVALSFALSIAATNMALGFCSVAFSEIVGATQPVYTVAVLLAFGVEFKRLLLLPVLVVVLGCGLTVQGAAGFSAVGFALVGLGNLARAVKGAGQQVLMTGETKERFEPFALLAWMCLAASAVIFISSFLTEGSAPYRKLQLDKDASGTLLAIGISAVNAVVLNLTSLFVVRELGAVGIILVGQTKAVLTVIGGVVLFGEVVSKIQCIGFAVVLLGTFAYSHMERMLKERAAMGKS